VFDSFELTTSRREWQMPRHPAYANPFDAQPEGGDFYVRPEDGRRLSGYRHPKGISLKSVVSGAQRTRGAASRRVV
jgi:hypothetical protein